MSGEYTGPVYTAEELKKMSVEERARHGAALDGVELVEYGALYVPGSPADKAAERSVAKWFLLTALLGAASVVLFIAWPWEYQDAYSGNAQVMYALFTPLVGLTLGGALLCFGVGVIALAKKIAGHEVAVQQRHVGMSAEVDRMTLGAEFADVGDKMGLIKRRGAIKGSLALAGGVVGVATAVPLLGGFIKNPWKERDQSALWVTPWAPHTDENGAEVKVRMAHQDGTLVRPEDIPAGSLTTVFPAVPGGASLAASDAPVMLFRLRSDAQVRIRDGQQGFEYGDLFAYSKICTHVGCPVSLYEQQTGRILCPCHQSQFDVFDGARPIFGPATRPLPQLPIDVDDEGYLYAVSDFIEPVGPGFWESNQGSRPWGSSPREGQ